MSRKLLIMLLGAALLAAPAFVPAGPALAGNTINTNIPQCWDAANQRYYNCPPFLRQKANSKSGVQAPPQPLPVGSGDPLKGLNVSKGSMCHLSPSSQKIKC
jgi:hypothetical protein